MKCHCCSGEAKYFAKFQNKNRIVRRFRCVRCGKTFTETQPLSGLRIETSKVAEVIRLLAEGVGVRAASRLSGLHQETILNILEIVGEQCSRFHDATIRNVPTVNVQTDELYSYVFCKQAQNKNKDSKKGEQFTFLSVCRESKLIISFCTGKRTRENAQDHLKDLHGRLANRIQLSTDNFLGYRGKTGAVNNTFGSNGVDYGMITKLYAKSLSPELCYAPPICILARKTALFGQPDNKQICTSHVERQNLNIRLFNRRFTRLTLGYSKKLQNLRHSIALSVCYWNFCWLHTTTKKTPAQASGLTDHLWTVEEMIEAISKQNSGTI